MTRLVRPNVVRRLLCAIAIAIGATAAPASAQMAIDRLWVDLDAGKISRSDLIVRNESKDRYYVTVTPSEVLDAGTPQESRIEVADPEKLGLLVTPGRLILDPGQMRAIRVVSLNEALTKDRVYRISITPQVGNLEVSGTNSEDRGIVVKMLTAFDVLVTVRPQNPVKNLTAARRGDTLVLDNTGNSNILLLDGKVCPVSGAALSTATQAFFNDQRKADEEAERKRIADANPGKDGTVQPDPAPAFTPTTYQPGECAKLPGRRLYAGNSWTVPEAPGETLTFDRRDTAAEDLKPITVRCNGGDGSTDSKFCTGASLDAATAVPVASPTIKPKGDL